MNRVFYGTLLSKAESHLQEIPVFINRARFRFFAEKSMDTAIVELREAIKVIEEAKISYQMSFTKTAPSELK